LIELALFAISVKNLDNVKSMRLENSLRKLVLIPIK
jgi:hypothetical protein